MKIQSKPLSGKQTEAYHRRKKKTLELPGSLPDPAPKEETQPEPEPSDTGATEELSE